MVNEDDKCTENDQKGQKAVHLSKEGEAMYRCKPRDQGYLFKELMPLGGQLDKENRWLKIKAMIPWRELEVEYAKNFSDRGRPGLDGRLVIGLFLLKHMTNRSDQEVEQEVRENVYWQAFCGMDHFVTGKQLNASSLSKIRKTLGPKFVEEMEEKTYRVLITKKIIKAKGMLVDGTVIPEKIRYPNDISLLNDVREWVVGLLRGISSKTGEKIRTYRRVARKTYLNFAKKKKKSKKMIHRAKREMLQYARRNIMQLEDRWNELDFITQLGVEKLLETAKKIYAQQYEMYRNKTNRVDERIVSWWRDYVRPIKRGKGGRKETEFGPKVSLSYVDGFTFVDEIRHDNYSEADTAVVEKQVENYCHKFGKNPPSLTGDQLYGSRTNRRMLEEKGIRGAFKDLGRKTKRSRQQEQYTKRKQRERNKIEGDIGNAKEHYGLDGIRYHDVIGSEMWIRLGFLGKNLKMALARVS